MPHTVQERVSEWALSGGDAGVELYQSYICIEYHADKRFGEYHPTTGPFPSFRVRLRDWLNSAPSEADQKTMLRLVGDIFFLGTSDFNALYRTAFRNQFAHWVLEQPGISIDEPDLAKLVLDEAKTSWFCPITDSMQIAAFYHVNGLSGRNERPDWHSLSRFGCEQQVSRFIKRHNIKRIVLLEDFVGSGSQMEPALDFAAALRERLPVLVIPLIICPEGVVTARTFCATHTQVSFRPVLELGEACFISPVATGADGQWTGAFRQLVKSLYAVVSGGMPANPTAAPFGPFGYRDTGCLTVTYANCPDNTVPLLHNASKSWKPLFPRSTRI